jgi:hypothetical protein
MADAQEVAAAVMPASPDLHPSATFFKKIENPVTF